MPRIHTLDMQRLTPLGQIIADYMRQQWPRLQTLADFAHLVDVRSSTVNNLLYSQHVASSRTLNKIAQHTGIPAERLYQAASAVIPRPIEAVSPPQPRQTKATLPPHVARRKPATALDEAVRRIRATEHPAMAEVMIQALLARAGQQDPRIYWQTRIEEAPPWDDHDAVSTLQLPAASSPARAASSEDAQPESQPAATCS